MLVQVLILIFSLLGLVFSDNTSNCDITDITESDWNFDKSLEFYDNEIDQHIFESTYNGIIDKLACTCTTGKGSACKRDYMNFLTNATSFFMYTTNNLQYFDEDMLEENSSPNIRYTCSMTCQISDKTSSLTFSSTIKDYNDYPPEFGSGDRTYKVASPMMPKTDFSFYGSPITATDKDFNNLNIKFEVTPAGFFDVTSSVDSSTIPSTFTASFRAKKVIQILDPRTYTITATDSGTHPRPLSSSITITLELDEETALETPTFVYPDSTLSYSFQYENDTSLKVIKGPITVKTHKPDLVSESISLSGDLSEHFFATFDTATLQAAIGITSKIDNPTSSYIILTLILETDSKVSTPVIIYFPNFLDEAPKFTKSSYTGSYNVTSDTIIMDNAQQIRVNTTSSKEPTVTIAGSADDFDFNTYFTLTKNSDHYEVTVNSSLPKETLEKEKSLVLTLEVDLDAFINYATLVINLPVYERYIKFEKALYNGAYDISSNGEVKFSVDSAVIVSEEDAANINVDFSEDFTYKGYFSISVVDKKVQITKTNNLAEEIYKKETVIAVGLKATISDTTITSSTVVNIKINYDAGYISFPLLSYSANYEITKDVASITDADKIVVETDQEDSVISVSIPNGYDKYFKAGYSNKAVTISLVSTSAIKELRSQTFISIELLAQIETTLQEAKSVINFKVIDHDSSDADNSTVKFSNLIYEGKCSLEKDKSVDLKINDIILETDKTDSEIDVKLENEYGYEKYFLVSHQDKKVVITLDGNLPKNIFDQTNFISFSLTATVIKTTSIQGQAVLNIQLIHETVEEKSTNNDTKYIIILSILVVIIVLLIGAAISFYYFKLRNPKLDQMTEEEYIYNKSKVRFDKSSSRPSGEIRKSSSTAIEQRRPTGFIFNSSLVSGEDEKRESTTDAPEIIKERKKSVAFDENVEKLQMDQISDDNIDKALNEDTKYNLIN